MHVMALFPRYPACPPYPIRTVVKRVRAPSYSLGARSNPKKKIIKKSREKDSRTGGKPLKTRKLTINMFLDRFWLVIDKNKFSFMKFLF